MALPFQRNDLITIGKLADWKAKYPIGRTIQMHDLGGEEKSYLVKDIEVDAVQVFHPETDEALFRCSVTLLPQ